MKITMLKNTSWRPPGVLLEGQEYDLRNDLAARLVESGAAQYVARQAVVEPTETAVSAGSQRRKPVKRTNRQPKGSRRDAG